uniref:Uncharacterized protein n=1 Tax=Anopheles dirus TaxID=7168 RepID=A0A182NWD6_9DIPT
MSASSFWNSASPSLPEPSSSSMATIERQASFEKPALDGSACTCVTSSLCISSVCSVELTPARVFAFGRGLLSPPAISRNRCRSIVHTPQMLCSRPDAPATVAVSETERFSIGAARVWYVREMPRDAFAMSSRKQRSSTSFSSIQSTLPSSPATSTKRRSMVARCASVTPVSTSLEK